MNGGMMMSKVDGYPLPIIDDELKIIGTVPFKDNLTLSHVPDYVNENGYMGLTRLGEGVHEGELVLMRYDKWYPNRSYAELVSEREAYIECRNKGRLDVAKELGICIEREREVI